MKFINFDQIMTCYSILYMKMSLAREGLYRSIHQISVEEGGVSLTGLDQDSQHVVAGIYIYFLFRK